jgi:hypothetical protein
LEAAFTEVKKGILLLCEIVLFPRGGSVGKVRVIYVASFWSEFISRELGWEHFPLEEFKLETDWSQFDGNVVVIAVGTNLSELNLLHKIPKKSVFVHLYADETYHPILNLKLLKCRSVKGVIRSYGIRKQRFVESELIFLKSVQLNFGLKHLQNLFRYTRSLLAGQILLLRQQFVLLIHRHYKVLSIDFVPGYTNLFAKTLLQVIGHDTSRESLLRLNYLCEYVSNIDRKFKFFFMGQNGTYWRRYAVDVLRHSQFLPMSAIIVRDSFGGTLGANGASLETGQEYVSGLLNSQVSICPPGNYSSSTFRYLESVICGAIPAIAEGIPTDTLFRAPFGPQETCKWARWEDLIRDCERLEEENRQLLVKQTKIKALEFFESFTEKNLITP